MKTGPHGGKRPGAGKPKGVRWPSSLKKEEARERLRQHITAELLPMTDAQIAHAKGIKYLVVRAKNGGKFLRVTEAMAKARLGDDEEIIEVWEKDPSTAAYIDLANRCLDKPKEQVQEVQVSGSLELVTRLTNARARIHAAP